MREREKCYFVGGGGTNCMEEEDGRGRATNRSLYRMNALLFLP